MNVAFRGWARLAALLLGFVVPFGGFAASGPALSSWGGDYAPPLVLKDIDGTPVDLAQLRGKVVLVNFWATWCGPCREEMPSMQKLRDRLAGKPFVVLAVNVDEPHTRVRNFVQETRLDLPILLDMNKLTTRTWRVRVMPTTFVIAPDGRIRYRALGDIDWNSDMVFGTISQLLSAR